MGAQDKVIVTCALTGVLATREQCPWVPYTPEEIAEEARRAYEAGAAVVHIHGRTEDGGPTFDPGIYRRIKEETRRRCPVILNFSTGGVGPMSERVDHIRLVRPEIGALNMGSMNYAKYSGKRKSFVFDFVFANPFEDIVFLLNAMKEGGVKPELECFDTGHVNNAWPLMDMGLLEAPLQFSLIMGVLGGIPATAENLAHQARQVPGGSIWEVIGIGRDQWRMVASALVLGGNVRVGLEDNFYLDAWGRQMARSNGELVARAVELARAIGREPASVEESRRMLGLPAAERAWEQQAGAPA
jgi:3-keto-5-aminohexanoate cleavage enzyme